MKGFRTIAVGLLMAVAPVGLQFLAGVDWTHYLPAQYAPVVAGLLMIALRTVTKTPIGKRS